MPSRFLINAEKERLESFPAGINIFTVITLFFATIAPAFTLAASLNRLPSAGGKRN